jgi:sirohydrochlorin ferrochelatase
MHTAIVLIAHGSRREEANAELRQLAASIGERRSEFLVVPAFLELAEPSIPVAVQACLAQGAREVRLFPYFLSAGVHVTRDLERFRQQFAAEHPDVEFRQLPPLGAHPEIARIVLDLLSE